MTIFCHDLTEIVHIFLFRLNLYSRKQIHSYSLYKQWTLYILYLQLSIIGLNITYITRWVQMYQVSHLLQMWLNMVTKVKISINLVIKSLKFCINLVIDRWCPWFKSVVGLALYNLFMGWALRAYTCLRPCIDIYQFLKNKLVGFLSSEKSKFFNIRFVYRSIYQFLKNKLIGFLSSEK